MPLLSLHNTARRIARGGTAILASLALIFGSALITSPAYAGELPEGYVGEVDGGEGNAFWEQNGGTRTLGTMTADQAYTGVIQGPDFGSPSSYTWVLAGGPTWLGLDTLEATEATLVGTPVLGEFSFDLIATDSAGESSWTLTFSGEVVSAKTATTTTLTANEFDEYWQINLAAKVNATAGNVQFAIDGVDVGEPQPIDANGDVMYSAAVDASKSGTTVAATARFLGSEVSASSTSTAEHIFLYSNTGVTGVVSQNGIPVSGAVVDLLEMPVTDETVPTRTHTTEGDGLYRFNFLYSELSLETIDMTYLIRATLPGGATVFYNSASAPGLPNPTAIESGEPSGPVTWIGAQPISYNLAPVWTDTLIATPRLGSSYAQDVSASGGEISYRVTEGWLPGGLSLNSDSGAITGTPTCMVVFGSTGSTCNYSFEITADNGYGTITHSFSGTLLEAGVPPTWAVTSPTELDLQLTVPFTGGVEAEGDPSIAYAVTGGFLPVGLSLNSDTGAITGTPECGSNAPFPFFAPFGLADPCAYSFRVTASNDYGSVDQLFSGTIAAAPELALLLDFKAGTKLDDASSLISAEGLKVGSEYTLTMYSTPVKLYTGTIGTSGGFTWTVALPADTPAGSHRLVLTGTAPDGSAMTAEAWFTLLADGTIGAISYDGAIAMGLPVTGVDVTVPLGAGAALLAMGGILYVSARRRSHGASIE